MRRRVGARYRVDADHVESRDLATGLRPLASCHRPGGTAFSLMTYADIQPRAVAVRDAVLSRRMPPWGAVKGFGNFRNDQALTQEQIELIVSWVASDMPRGRNRQVLPKEPTFTRRRRSPCLTGRSARVARPRSTARALDGLVPEHLAPDQSLRVVARLPDGQVRPLVWLHGYDGRTSACLPLPRRSSHLPKNTAIQGIPPVSSCRSFLRRSDEFLKNSSGTLQMRAIPLLIHERYLRRDCSALERKAE